MARKAHPRLIAVMPLYFQLAPVYEIPAEVGIGQASWETNDGKYTGQVPASYHNWCGLKTHDATGDKPTDHFKFPDDATGVEAHLQHLRRYGGRDLPAGRPLLDPRYDLVSVRADNVENLGGRWAPDPNYGTNVAIRIDTIRAYQGPVSLGDDPRYAWVPDPNEFGYPADPSAPNPGGIHGRNGQPIELFILHITAGTDSLGWLTGPNGSSAHYLTDQAGRPRAQMVADADAAWTPGSRPYALRSINLETEMLHVTDWTDAIMREVARSAAPILVRRNIPAVYLGRDNGPGKRGMIGHRDVPDGQGGWGGVSHHDDPGANFDWVTFCSYVAAEMHAPAPDPLVMPPLDPVKRDGFYVPYVFGSFWDTRGGLELFGHWVSGVIEERQRLVQYTERSRFEYHPDLPGAVQLGLAGLEVLAGRHPDLL